MRNILPCIFLCLSLLISPAGAADKGLTVKAVRSSTYSTFTRIVFDVEAAAPYSLTRSQDGRNVLLSSYEGQFLLKSPLPVVHDGVIAGIESLEEGGRNYAVIHLDAAAAQVKDFALRGPDRIVIDVAKRTAPPAVSPAGDRPLIIVIDPGHGGKDTGLLTARGLEKTVDLELSLTIRNLLQKNDHVKVLLTREKDQTLSLDERAAFANAAGAAIFVSIHGTAGTESHVYIQDISGDMGEIAVQTKAVSGDFLGFETGSEQQELVWGMQQAAHIRQSGGLGRRLVRQLSGSNSAEPVQVPLAELSAVDAAAVMIEIGMDQERANVAESIARGIEQYVRDDR
ncbi:MAG TPA: N-acetylmuramoyl-L-alanine amidase [Nitrospirota bacterium]|nr:N-acetylmuramoyl-L-alanine amidase [Nitrospirota bacterium]